MKSYKYRILCLFLVLLFSLGTMPVMITTALEDKKDNPFVLYEEDFNTITSRVDLVMGENYANGIEGWIYAKNTAGTSAYVENGRLYFSGSSYDVIYRDGGQTWGNYILEADFCYTNDNVGWGGMLYNVQSAKKFQKTSISPAGSASANGYDNGWTNNSSTHNKLNMTSEALHVPKAGEPFRMRVSVENKTADFYYAMLNTDGTLKSDYILLRSISNIPANAQTGSIGFMTSTGKLGSFWVDNIKCYSYSTVSYTENFDSYANTTLKNNSENTDNGLYYDKNSSSGTAYIEDGKLYLSGGGKDFDSIFFTMGRNWSNYTLEADFTYTADDSGWGALLYRSTDTDNFQKAAVSPNKRGYLNGQKDGSWYKDSEGVSKLNYSASLVRVGEPFRLKIETKENSAQLYIAYYDADSRLGAWNYVMSVNENFSDVHMTGTIGMIVGGNSDSNTCSICVDNITVSRGPDRIKAPVPTSIAQIYEPISGIVNPPVVVQQLADTLPPVSGRRAAVVLMETDGTNILNSQGQVLTSLDHMIDTFRNVLIPAFIVDSESEADAIATKLHEKELIDCYVVADAKQADLVKRVRIANSTTACITGALIFEDLNSPEARKAAHSAVADHMSYIAISKEPIDLEAANYFNLRQIGVWSFAEDEAGVYKGIYAGYHGLISTDTDLIYDIYESITEPTVSGKPVIVAHRGANKTVGYPENTLMGYEAAVKEFGADAVEIDVRMTKDGYLYLMHDDTLDRTTNGTGSGASFTLEQIKKMTVDEITGKETEVPTFEELLQLAKELDIVVYCHINVKNDATVAAFSHLVEKYGCQDRVIFFISFDSRVDYNSNTNKKASDSAYGLVNSPVVADGLIFTAGNAAILENLDTYAKGVAALRRALTVYNYQALFYPYSNQGSLWNNESFYYQASARGFVNSHSITNGQNKMNNLALVGAGAVGYLTDNINLSSDYHYAIKAKNETLNVGCAPDSIKTLLTISGNKSVKCGWLQLEGPELISVDGAPVLNEAGTSTLVWYTDCTVGGCTYRVFSEPVQLTFVVSSVDTENPSADKGDNGTFTPEQDTADVEHSSDSDSTVDTYLIIGIVCAVVLLAIGTVATILFKRHRNIS